MSKYTTYYTTRKDIYKKFAESWKAWASTADLTEEQERGMSIFFKCLGKRFGLINEFKNIGVI